MRDYEITSQFDKLRAENRELKRRLVAIEEKSMMPENTIKADLGAVDGVVTLLPECVQFDKSRGPGDTMAKCHDFWITLEGETIGASSVSLVYDDTLEGTLRIRRGVRVSKEGRWEFMPVPVGRFETVLSHTKGMPSIILHNCELTMAYPLVNADASKAEVMMEEVAISFGRIEVLR